MKRRLMHTRLTQSSFVKLIQAYTVILAVMIVGATTVFIWVNVRNYESEVRQAETSVTARITDAVSRDQTVVSDFAASIVSGADNLTNLEKFFSTDLSTYADYAIDQSIASGKYFFWPTETREFLLQNPDVDTITLRLLDQKKGVCRHPGQTWWRTGEWQARARHANHRCGVDQSIYVKHNWRIECQLQPTKLD